MEAAVECTHCRVVMTSWSVPGSPIRYYQCPFCARTHSSLYGEVFRRHAGARMVEAPVQPAPTGLPMATADDVRWAKVRASAARWFAKLEAEERSSAGGVPARPSRSTRVGARVKVEGAPAALPLPPKPRGRPVPAATQSRPGLAAAPRTAVRTVKVTPARTPPLATPSAPARRGLARSAAAALRAALSRKFAAPRPARIEATEVDPGDIIDVDVDLDLDVVEVAPSRNGAP